MKIERVSRGLMLASFLLLGLLLPHVCGNSSGSGYNNNNNNNNFVHNKQNSGSRSNRGNGLFNNEVIGSRERGRRTNEGRSISNGSSSRSSSSSSSSVGGSESTSQALTRSKAFAGFDSDARGGMGENTFFSSQYSQFQQRQPQPSVQHPQEVNPLLKKATEGSVGLLFLLLTWRSLSTYELAGIKQQTNSHEIYLNQKRITHLL